MSEEQKERKYELIPIGEYDAVATGGVDVGYTESNLVRLAIECILTVGDGRQRKTLTFVNLNNHRDGVMQSDDAQRYSEDKLKELGYELGKGDDIRQTIKGAKFRAYVKHSKDEKKNIMRDEVNISTRKGGLDGFKFAKPLSADEKESAFAALSGGKGVGSAKKPAGNKKAAPPPAEKDDEIPF